MLRIAPATAEDCDRLAELQFDAFAPSLIHQRLFGDVPKPVHVRHVSAQFKQLVNKPGNALHKAVVKSDDGREVIVGVAHWDTPRAEADTAEAQLAQGTPDEQTEVERLRGKYPPGTNFELCRAFFRRRGPTIAESHYYLHLLATDPAHQRTGAGSAMIRWGARRADEAGVPSYLKAAGSAIALYEKFGYGVDDPSELSTLCQIYLEAFGPTRLWRYKFHPDLSKDAAGAFFLNRLEKFQAEASEGDGSDKRGEATREGHKRLTVAKRGDRVVGFAMWTWIPKRDRRRAEPQPIEVELPRGGDKERIEGIMNRLYRSTYAWDRAKWYLSILAISPEAQGTGIGRHLVQEGIDQAKRDGGDVVLVSTELGRVMYAKIGFVDFGEPVPAPLDPAVIDCARLAELQHEAFSPSIINRVLFGNVARPAAIEHSTQRIAKLVGKPGTALHKATIRDPLGQDVVVGLAYWALPQSKEDKEREKAEEDKDEDGKTPEDKKRERFAPGSDWERADRFFARLDPGVDEPHYHLHLLAIDPVRQRTGAGGALLRWGCRKADEAGLDSYLEATDVGIGLYKKYGFEMFREPIVDEEMILWPMRRQPLKISHVAPSDFPALLPIYFDAFRPTNLWRYNFNDVTREASDKFFTRRLEKFWADLHEDGDKAATVDAGERNEHASERAKEKKRLTVAKRGDQVVGFAMWTWVPDQALRDPDNESKQIEVELPEGANKGHVDGVMKLMNAASHAYERANYYLSILVIRPDQQGTGVGRQLLQEGVDRAKRDGGDVVLVSTELGKAMYEKFGFVHFGEPVVAPEDPSVISWPMVYKN
ncbi:hypothetical protein JCM10212_004812 [Sporobolomyces blumeae]